MKLTLALRHLQRKLGMHGTFSIMLPMITAIICVVASQSKAATTVEDFVTDGVHVLLEPTTANQIVSVVVNIDGGFGFGDAQNPVLAQMLATVTTASGSEHYPKDAYREALSRLVTSIDADASRFSLQYTLSCVKPKLDESWKIFADVIRSPRYDESELARIRQVWLSDIAGRHADPEGSTVFTLDSLWSGNAPAWRTETAEDVNAVTINGGMAPMPPPQTGSGGHPQPIVPNTNPQNSPLFHDDHNGAALAQTAMQSMRLYHDRMLDRSRMTVVIVGNVSKAEAMQMVSSAFGSLPISKYRRPAYPRVTGPEAASVTIENRTVPTAYLYGRYLTPARTDSEYYPLLLGHMILDDRLYEEVRTKRNLSYSPHAHITGRTGKYFGQLSVSTTMPDSTMHVIIHELDDITRNGVTAKELKDRRAEFITEYYMAQQSNLAVAEQLLTALLETGDWHATERVIANVNRVTTAQIKLAMQRYVHDITWTGIGDERAIDRHDFLFR